MINRINLILRTKNITARQFAEEIGIQPSGMSHIMSGRNNPSLEFVSKVLRRYPEIDANWLLLGKGAMYAPASVGEASERVAHEVRPVEQNLFSMMEEEEPAVPAMPEEEAAGAAVTPAREVAEPAFVTDKEAAEPAFMSAEEATEALPRPDGGAIRAASMPYGEAMAEAAAAGWPTMEAQPSAAEGPRAGGRRAVRLVMLYDDRTFEDYRPGPQGAAGR